MIPIPTVGRLSSDPICNPCQQRTNLRYYKSTGFEIPEKQRIPDVLLRLQGLD